MENFELIEKYVAGQLDGAEKQAFEKQLQAEPSLQNDVALQKQIINGIKKARITEIKSMLNQVPVGSAAQVGAATAKIVTGIVIGTVVTGAVIYFKPWKQPIAPTATTTEKPVIEPRTEKPAILNEPIAEVKENKTAPASNDVKTKKEVVIPKTKTAQPKIDVVDPTEELTTSKEVKESSENKRIGAEVSHIVVETDGSNSKYSFHYQFIGGKLMLYGNFDKELYEILEVHGDAHSVFLFFKENYYALNEKQSSITPLVAIKDLQLVRKLKEYRSR